MESSRMSVEFQCHAMKLVAFQFLSLGTCSTWNRYYNFWSCIGTTHEQRTEGSNCINTTRLQGSTPGLSSTFSIPTQTTRLSKMTSTIRPDKHHVISRESGFLLGRGPEDKSMKPKKVMTLPPGMDRVVVS